MSTVPKIIGGGGTRTSDTLCKVTYTRSYASVRGSPAANDGGTCNWYRQLLCRRTLSFAILYTVVTPIIESRLDAVCIFSCCNCVSIRKRAETWTSLKQCTISSCQEFCLANHFLEIVPRLDKQIIVNPFRILTVSAEFRLSASSS